MTEGATPKPLENPSRSRSVRLAAGAAGLALGLALVGAGPAMAQTDGDVERPTDRERATTDVRPERVPVERPDRPERPERDLEVLRLACGIADDDTGSDDATRVHIGCRWRAATSERAAGYQLWRIVDRGERELVARGGLDVLGARDVVSAEAHVVRYAVIAVDENGRRVGQSRVQWVDLDDGADERDEHDRRLAARARAHRSIAD